MRTAATKCVGAVALLSVVGASHAISQTSDVYRDIPPEAVECIIEHIDAYLAAGRSIYIIRPADCPEPSILANADKDKTNMVGGRFYTKEQKERMPTVVYRPAQMRCLKEMIAKGGVSALPRDPCG